MEHVTESRLNASEAPEPAMMTGALPDNHSQPRSQRHTSVDHVVPTESSRPEDPIAASRRRKSFFVVAERRRDGEANIAAPERIEIKPAQRATTFEIGKSKKRRDKRTRLSSLEAILRAHTDPEDQVPLPQSRTTSISSDEDLDHAQSPGNRSRSSLDIVSQFDPFGHPRPSPVSVPLPESRPASIEELRDPQQLVQQTTEQEEQQRQQRQQRLQSKRQARRAGLRLFDYQQMLDFASEVLPHLTTGRIHASTRHDTLNISYVDYGQSFRSPLMTKSGDLRNDHIIGWLGTIPDNVKQRLIIVEDLSPRTIHCLGTRFGVSPEFFEEHLINSGYNGAVYNDASPKTWTTSGMKKSYCSVKWHRPVYRLPMVPYSNQDLNDLLDPSCNRVEYTSDISSDLNIFQTENNIFRSEWDLWTDPKTTTRVKRVCGWEEKASIWSQRLPERDCRIVILLLDPLPTLGEGIERDVFAARRLVSASDSGSLSESTRTDDAAALDRLAEHIQERYTNQPPISWLQRILNSMLPMGESKPKNDSDSEISQAFELVETTKFNKIRSRNIFEQIAPRAHLNIDFEEAFQTPVLMENLRRHLHDTQSTKEDFYQRLIAVENSNTEEYFGVLEPLSQIISQDARSLLKLLDKTLDGIDAEIQDETKIEENLSTWRRLISRSQIELSDLRDSMGEFFSFFGVLFPINGPRSANEVNRISKDFREVANKIEGMLGRLRTSSTSLTSNMALLDSRRSIAEAQAVKKLTELAFFFIPLTFAASLFGMQVEPLEDPAPLSTFIILGVAFTASSYLVRLTIRSQWLRGLKVAYNASIKVYADSRRLPVRQKGSVPASLFLMWLGYEMSCAIRVFLAEGRRWLTETLPKSLSAMWDLTKFVIYIILMIGVIAAAPIAVLWTRKMAPGVQTIITIVILFSVIGLVVVPYWRHADPDTRSAIPNLVKKKFKHLNIRASPLILAIIVCVTLAVPIIPLAVIWTKPISRGVKAAVTVVIVLIVVVMLITWGIYRLVYLARVPFMSESGTSSRSGSSLASD
ncbi:hypothetical protein PVAG01_07585 [Phlyctema vagabunda]|uniref:Mg2+ transporter protein, CorA-like/Zinc transport protein ZntB n=1 Tax=Phlyctema vagabunda TaxID=108571 RepID=A0ABR4PCT8_9HELO